MSHKNSHFAVLKLGRELSGGELTSPTEIANKRILTIDKPIPYNDFVYGNYVEEFLRSHKTYMNSSQIRTFRFFKNDLSLATSEINISLPKAGDKASDEKRKEIALESKARKNAIKWSMQNFKGSSEKLEVDTLIKASSTTSNVLFNPLDAAEIFIANILKISLLKVDNHFPRTDRINVHITIPAFNDSKVSENYRNNLEKIIEEIQKKGVAANVQFNIKGTGDFLYEPYSVFYYYSAVEGMINIENAKGETYLIFDMGGSTTDLAVVQVNQSGKHSKVYPIATSIKHAGSDFDEFLLEHFIKEMDDSENLSHVHIDEALKDLERVKIKICKGSLKQHTVKIGKKTHVVDSEILKTVVDKWWEHPKNEIKSGIKNFLTKTRSVAKNNPQFLSFQFFEKIFLAGGSISLLGIREKILVELKSYLKDTDSESIFAMPKNAPVSSVTAIGLAYEIALRSNYILSNGNRTPLLERAEKVFCRIGTDGGVKLNFKHRDKSFQTDNDDDILIYDAYKAFKDSDFENKNYSPLLIKKRDILNNNIVIQMRTNLDSYDETLDDQEENTIPLDKKIIDSIPEEMEVALGFSHKNPKVKTNKEGELELNFRTSFFKYESEIKVNNPARIDSRERGAVKVKFTPPKIINTSNTIHLCIDFGMSNTSVAVFSPNSTIPNHADFHHVELHKNPFVQNEKSSNEPKIEETLKNDQSGIIAIDNPPIQTKKELNELLYDLLNKINSNSISLFPNDILEKLVNNNKIPNEKDLNPEKVRLAVNETLKQIKEPINKNNEVPDNPRLRANNIAVNWSANNEIKGYESSEFSFSKFRAFLKKSNFYYSEKIKHQVWSHAMNDMNGLLILSGPPGTGKTSLVRLTSEFFNSLDPNSDDDNFAQKTIAVSPTWFSPSSILGAYSEIDETFHSTPFLEFSLLAEEFFIESGKDKKYAKKFFLCLDEFNLAHPEQYFSSILSSMEFKYGQSGGKIKICDKYYLKSENDLELSLPPNLKLFATINTDSTSKLLSPKVLDRSILIPIIPNWGQILKFIENQESQIESDSLYEKAVYKSLINPNDPEKGIMFELYTLAQKAQIPLGFRGLDKLKTNLSNHPFVIDNVKFSENKVKHLVDELIHGIFLTKLPGIYNVQGSEYSDHIDNLLSSESNSNLLKLTSVKRIIEKLNLGYAGQTAF